ncbi:hypothetical protein M1O19_00210 [Dehalococcoidia bacterium]|nr:hypothetical protein [Dehalococcoidia bacterium]MCL0096953.1 hypothetical protein [Dehalococcoidia bacterium]
MIEVQLQIEEKHRGLVHRYCQCLRTAGLAIQQVGMARVGFVTLSIDETHELTDAVRKMHTKVALEEWAKLSEADRLGLLTLIISLDNEFMNSLLKQ